MSDKYIKEITQNIPNDELNSAYDALMNINLNETSDYEEVSMEELNEYIEGLECQAEDLRTQLAKANERIKELEHCCESQEKNLMRQCVFMEKTAEKLEQYREWQPTASALRRPTREAKQALNRFAIEKQIQELNWCLSRCNHSFDSWADVGMYDSGISNSEIEARIKQLRKEQENV